MNLVLIAVYAVASGILLLVGVVYPQVKEWSYWATGTCGLHLFVSLFLSLARIATAARIASWCCQGISTVLCVGLLLAYFQTQKGSNTWFCYVLYFDSSYCSVCRSGVTSSVANPTFPSTAMPSSMLSTLRLGLGAVGRRGRHPMLDGTAGTHRSWYGRQSHQPARGRGLEGTPQAGAGRAQYYVLLGSSTYCSRWWDHIKEVVEQITVGRPQRPEVGGPNPAARTRSRCCIHSGSKYCRRHKGLNPWLDQAVRCFPCLPLRSGRH